MVAAGALLSGSECSRNGAGREVGGICLDHEPVVRDERQQGGQLRRALLGPVVTHLRGQAQALTPRWVALAGQEAGHCWAGPWLRRRGCPLPRAGQTLLRFLSRPPASSCATHWGPTHPACDADVVPPLEH